MLAFVVMVISTFWLMFAAIQYFKDHTKKSAILVIPPMLLLLCSALFL